MKKIEVESISKYIEEADIDINLMFLGDSGIGKTAVLKKYCKKNNIYLKTLVLSHLDASEALGVPCLIDREFNGKTYKQMGCAIPGWVFDLAEHKNDKVPPILFLDEFLCAEPSVMNSFLNFLTEKEVEGIDLSFVRVVSATNIGNYTYEPDVNMIRRFCMFWVTNNNFETHLKNDFINANFVEEVPEDDVLFKERTITPRTLEWSLKMKNSVLFEDFYEGFTNTKPVYRAIVSTGVRYANKVNAIVSPFVIEGTNNIDPNLVSSVYVALTTAFRKSDYSKIIDTFEKTQTKEIMEKLRSYIES